MSFKDFLSRNNASGSGGDDPRKTPPAGNGSGFFVPGFQELKLLGYDASQDDYGFSADYLTPSAAAGEAPEETEDLVETLRQRLDPVIMADQTCDIGGGFPPPGSWTGHGFGDSDLPILMADQACDIDPNAAPPDSWEESGYVPRDTGDPLLPLPDSGGCGAEPDGYLAVMEPMTGYTQYTYYHGNQELGGAMAHNLPGFPADICGCGLSLSTFFASTVCPGCIREIQDVLSHTRWGTVTYLDNGEHLLKAQGAEIRICCRNGEWEFLHNGSSLGTLKRQDTATAKKLVLTPSDAIDDDLALIMMSFPLLQIAW